MKNNNPDLTYSEAIEKVMLNNGYFAPLKLLYKEVWDYKDKNKITGITPENTIQERVQRDERFTRIAKGVYALTDFIEKVEKEDLGFFAFDRNRLIFKAKKKIKNTEKIVEQKIRIGQSYFRNRLLSEMSKCPVTGIDDKRILIASHIKPWVHSSNEERINVKNGILLSPLFDKLFDRGTGLITFTLDKKILISSRISKENINRLKIYPNQVIEELDVKGREEFLEYHKKHIFQD